MLWHAFLHIHTTAAVEFAVLLPGRRLPMMVFHLGPNRFMTICKQQLPFTNCCGMCVPVLLQIVVDVTNPMKSDYKKLGQPPSIKDADCICDVESKDADQLPKGYRTSVGKGVF